MMASSFRTLFRSLVPCLLLVTAAVGGFVAFALPAAVAAEGANPAPASLASGVQPGAPPALAILFTGEVIGWTEPCG